MIQRVLADRLRCPRCSVGCMQPQNSTSGKNLIHDTGAAELHECNQNVESPPVIFLTTDFRNCVCSRSNLKSG